MSFIKERSTQSYLVVKRKFQHKESKLYNVRYALITNQFLNTMKGTSAALERGQLIIRTRAVPVKERKTDLINKQPRFKYCGICQLV